MSDSLHHGDTPRERLRHLAEHLEHVLPAQAPIRDFVHHNTLHGYQHLPFPEALRQARLLTGAQGYLPPERFRELYAQGRIDAGDLRAALERQLGREALAAEVMPGLTRGTVLETVLCFPFKRLSRTQLKWQLEEMAALRRFQDDVPEAARAALLGGRGDVEAVLADLWAACLDVLGLEHARRHPEDVLAEAAPRLAEEGARGADATHVAIRVRETAHALLDELLGRLGHDWSLRTLLRALTGEDLLESLRPALIRPLAAHIDQGLAGWHAPEREQGFYAAWRAAAWRDPAWRLDDLDEWDQTLERLPEDALETVLQELRLMGLPEADWPGYMERLALELPGWAGMALQMQLRGPAASGGAPVALMDFLAVRLVLERLHAQRICRRHWRIEASLNGLRAYFHHQPAELLVRHALFEGKLPEYLVDFAERLVRDAPYRDAAGEADWEPVARLLWQWRQSPALDRRAGFSVGGSAWPLYRLAQHLGLSGPRLRAAGRAGAEALLGQLTALDVDQTGHVWLLAYERHYREQIFTALAANHGRGSWASRPRLPEAQLVWCMDDREEGIRRHLEEINPRLETLGAAAHFGVFINWYGLGDAEPTGLCPVVARPAHSVREGPAPGQEQAAVRLTERRASRGQWRYRLLQGSRRGVLGAAAWSALGAPAAGLLLAGKALFPATLARWGGVLARRSEGRAETRLVFTAPDDAPPASVAANRPGFDTTEQADRCQNFLRNIGLTDGFAPLVVIMGHGSNSLNNPHMAAYDCGACSGRHSGPNARLFAAMANRPETRELLRQRGIHIPDGTWFLGAEHNTCDDGITWYDLDQIPAALRGAFERLKADVDAAALAHMQERCRRFASAPERPGPEQARRHILGRRWDYGQPRPELGHATNACAVIGRRSVTRGAFFDRRAFLISYDPTRDPEGKVLEGLLLANGPVGAGISLEYYFSTVDNERYGCGTKVVHNVAGYFGVMEGAGSDLRTGLPRQMIEIHEAMRLLVVVEHKIDVVTAIYQRQPPLQELIGNGWLVVAAKDPDSPAIHLFDPDLGWLSWTGSVSLPRVPSSRDWFEGHREPLPPALLDKPLLEAPQ